MDSSRRDVFKNIGYLDYIFFFSFSNYRPLPIPEVTLLSPKIALNFRLRLGKAYLFGYGELRPKKRNASKTGNDVIIFSTPCVIPLDLSRRDFFKNIQVNGINSIRFRVIEHFLNRK